MKFLQSSDFVCVCTANTMQFLQFYLMFNLVDGIPCNKIFNTISCNLVALGVLVLVINSLPTSHNGRISWCFEYHFLWRE